MGAAAVRPVAFAAVAVAVAVTLAVAGSGRILLACLPRRRVAMVPGRRALVVVVALVLAVVPVVTVAMRQAWRDRVPVADGAAARRRLQLLGLSGWDVVSMAERTPVLASVALRRRLRLIRHRSRSGRRGGSGSCGRRWPGSSVRARRCGMAAVRRLVRRTADRVRVRAPVNRRQAGDDGRRLRRLRRRRGPRVRLRRRGSRRHRDLCRGGRRRAGTGIGADPDRPEMGGEMARAGVEDQGHRCPAEHERDNRRRRYASECPECTSFAAFVGRQRPFLPVPLAFPGLDREI